MKLSYNIIKYMSLIAKTADEWYGEHANYLPPGYLEQLRTEHHADRILAFSTVLMPGLLQTEAYADTVVVQVGRDFLSRIDLNRRVQVRIQRQQQLFERLDTVRLHVLIDESVIRRQVGGLQAFTAQLYRLTELIKLHNVTLQILPFSSGIISPLVDLSSFDIYYTNKKAMMSLERKSLDQENTHNNLEVAFYSRLFHNVCEQALDEKDSYTLIMRHIHELEAQIMEAYPSHD